MGPMLFVYGTLMPGHLRWPLIEHYVLSSEPATVPGRLYDTGRGYPAARFDVGGAIDGHLLTFHPDAVATAWATVDAIEAEGRLYRRVPVATVVGVSAQSYAWAGDTTGLVALGRRWVDARRSTP